jgi:hypothetical protein
MTACGATVPDKNASGDAFYGASICSQPFVDYFWNTYGFFANSTWNASFGYDDCCNDGAQRSSSELITESPQVAGSG